MITKKGKEATRTSLFTRQPRSTLSKVAFRTFLVGTIASTGGAVAITIGSGAPSRDIVNHLSFGVTIHWHGVHVPNSADGVAGVTQDAVKPGQSYVYRFTALDAGTYWYHSHQFSYEETTNGLYGMLIVDPATSTLHADVDYSVALHSWAGPNNQTLYTMNATDGTLHQAARPGQWVRLRIVNTAETPSGNPQLVTLVGAPFQVVSLDGHDLNGPQWLNDTPLPMGSAQRYDLYFQMPSHGSVALVTAGDSQGYVRAPALVIGQGSVPTKLPAITKWFDLTTYGTPAPDPVTARSRFNATYNIVLGNQIGSSLGRTGMTYTMNGKVFPDTGMIMVKEGQLIKLHFDNHTNLYHPMHLHGHVFTVLEENGKPLTGSPVHQDTVLVPPHTTYDVAFVANHPGIWMLHCHNFLHANCGSGPCSSGQISGCSAGSASSRNSQPPGRRTLIIDRSALSRSTTCTRTRRACTRSKVSVGGSSRATS